MNPNYLTDEELIPFYLKRCSSSGVKAYKSPSSHFEEDCIDGYACNKKGKCILVEEMMSGHEWRYCRRCLICEYSRSKIKGSSSKIDHKNLQCDHCNKIAILEFESNMKLCCDCTIQMVYPPIIKSATKK